MSLYNNINYQTHTRITLLQNQRFCDSSISTNQHLYRTIWTFSKMASPASDSLEEQDGADAKTFFQAEELYLDEPFVDPPPFDGDKPDTTSFQSELDHLLAGLSGKQVLVLLPTENADKIEVLKAVVPPGFDVQFEVVKSKADVGEQPYNTAGIKGAMNRIKNALQSFATGSSPLGSAEVYCKTHDVGRILVVASENYIAGTLASYDGALKTDLLGALPGTKNEDILSETGMTLESAIDHGFACLYDANRDTVFAAHCRGVRVPELRTASGCKIDLVAYARSQGFIDANHEHGMQTVGKTIQAFVKPTPGKDYTIGANWHADVTGWTTTRYDLLKEAMAKIRDQATEAGVFRVT